MSVCLHICVCVCAFLRLFYFVIVCTEIELGESGRTFTIHKGRMKYYTSLNRVGLTQNEQVCRYVILEGPSRRDGLHEFH